MSVPATTLPDGRMRAVDLCAGAGGWDVFADRDDIDVIGVELDAAACRTRAAAGLATVQADLLTVDPAAFAAEHGPFDGICGSPPCFPAGTPVLTARGVVPIEMVRRGDLVLTHRGRWRAVTGTMSRTAPVFTAGQIAATADHPFLARAQVREYVRREREWQLDPPEWTPAAKTHGRFVALPASADYLPMPPIPGRPINVGSAFWYMVGRWLGDGWLRLVAPDPRPRRQFVAYPRSPARCERCGAQAAPHGRYAHLSTLYCGPTCKQAAKRARRVTSRSDVLICCSREEADGLASRLAATGLRWRRSEERTTVRFTAHHVGLARWLADNFGRYAHGKTLPGWALGMAEDRRAALLAGYLDADGCTTQAGFSAATVSRCLAVGVRLLATTLGYTTSLFSGSPSAVTGSIEGREINERPQWVLLVNRDDGRYTRLDGRHRWVKQREPLVLRGEETVYDLTVADDHSFVAHGLVVHNCTLFSTAGSGAGRAQQVMDALHRTIRAAALGETRVALARRRRTLAQLLRGLLLVRVPKSTRGWRTWEAERQARILALMWQPAMWTAALRPRWVALEQVPPVLPLWETMASALEAVGYRCWTGLLSSERFGVPQTRRRAFLLASLDGQPHPPEATHQAYVPGRPRCEPEPDLFGPGLLPWVSMSDALGWGGGGGVQHRRGGDRLEEEWSADRPSDAITHRVDRWQVGFPRRDDTGSGVEYRERDFRRDDEPAHTVTEKGRSASRFPVEDPEAVTWGLKANGQTNSSVRRADMPAPTITAGGHDTANRQWVPEDPERGTTDRGQADGDGTPAGPRQDAATTPATAPAGQGLDQDTNDPAVPSPESPARAAWTRERPAPTVVTNRLSKDGGLVGRQLPPGEGNHVGGRDWTHGRPATTVAGDARVFPPGHKVNDDDRQAGRGGQLRSGAGWTETRPATTMVGDGRATGPHSGGGRGESQSHAAVRVTATEAAVLQSFPVDWPWQGTRTMVFQQIGNAVPPLLARHVLAAVTAPSRRTRREEKP